jgi:hypothetical protein
MNLFNRILLVTGLSVYCLTSLAHAQAKSADDTCQKIEYAELKDTPKDDLIATYCNYTALQDIKSDEFHALLKVKPVGSVDPTADANEARLQAAQCGEEADRIFRILERTYKMSQRPTKADCDANNAAMKARREKAKQTEPTKP